LHQSPICKGENGFNEECFLKVCRNGKTGFGTPVIHSIYALFTSDSVDEEVMVAPQGFEPFEMEQVMTKLAEDAHMDAHTSKKYLMLDFSCPPSHFLGPFRTACRLAKQTNSEGGDMEPILVATGARPFSRLILTRGDEDVNFDHVERKLGFRFFRRLSIRVKPIFYGTKSVRSRVAAGILAYAHRQVGNIL
jgi:hypothetical protein